MCGGDGRIRLGENRECINTDISISIFANIKYFQCTNTETDTSSKAEFLQKDGFWQASLALIHKSEFTNQWVGRQESELKDWGALQKEAARDGDGLR